MVSSFGAPIGTFSSAPGTGTNIGGVSITFTDLGISGGIPTNAFLEVTADGALGQIVLTRLVFDDGVGTPEVPDLNNVVGQGAFPEGDDRGGFLRSALADLCDGSCRLSG